MGKLGAGWPADVGTVSMHCQLLLGVPISYIHFLMNCFNICAGEFLILQIFDVTRHLLDSVTFSLYLTMSSSLYSSSALWVCVMCTFCRDNTCRWRKSFFTRFLWNFLSSLNSFIWELLCFKRQEGEEGKVLKESCWTQVSASPQNPGGRSLCP